MGRPRKRQHVEELDESSNERLYDDPLDFDIPFDTSNYAAYDGAVGETIYSNGVPAAGQIADTTNSGDPRQGRGTGLDKWHFGDSGINPRSPLNFADFGAVPIDDPARSLGTAPQLSADSSTSICEDSQPAGPCSCLASMYLSLAALQQLPTDIVAALLSVRSAAQTAAQSIWCPQCGSIVLDSPSPPIEAFQNTMLLGTILPIIANGYHRLLKMVDEETDLAEATGQTKTFRFNDYGGLSGKVKTADMAVACFEKDLYFNLVEMAPQQWRTTVRAMLRVDIYGHEQPGFKHRGLKDLVTEMEARQIARHALVDAAMASGTMEKNVLGVYILGEVIDPLHLLTRSRQQTVPRREDTYLPGYPENGEVLYRQSSHCVDDGATSGKVKSGSIMCCMI